MTEMIGRLRVALGLETAAFEKGAKRAGAEINALGSTAEKVGFKIGSLGKTVAAGAAALAGGALASQLRAIVDESLRYAQTVGRMSELSGTTAVEFQKAAYAARTVGIETEQLADIYKDVNDKFGEFMQTGGGELKDFFDTIAPKVGVTAAQFRDLSGPQALQLYVSTLEKAGVNSQEMTFYMEALANDASKLAPILRNNGEGFSYLADQAEKAGTMLSAEQIAKADQTAIKLEQLNAALQVQMAVVVTDNAAAITALASALQGLVRIAGRVATEFSNFTLARGEFEARIMSYKPFVSGEVRQKYAKRADEFALARRRLDPRNVDQTGSFRDYTLARIDETPYLHQRPWTPPSTGSKKAGGGKKSGGGGSAASSAAREAEKLATAMQKLSVWGNDASKAIGAANDNLVAFADRAGPALDRVPPAFNAAKLKAAEFADELVKLQSRLFPEIDAMAKYRGELDLITRALESNKISAQQAAEWRHRLAMEGRGTDLVADDNQVGAIELDMDKIGEGLDTLYDRMRGFRDKNGVLMVQVAKSFKDMADDSLAAMNNLASAVQGGGFLNILSAVIGMGLQLGSVGAFGKSIQTNINLPRRAWGGQINAGQAYMVGERGPEMFVAGGNGNIVPNHRLGGGGGGRTQVEVLPSKYFDVRVMQSVGAAAPSIVEAGAQTGISRMARANARSLAR